ncbi:MAG: DnaJ domain-containing protein [Burkholderiales bacterium]|jgi:hypothetical protein
MKQTLYDILGVARDASFEDIEVAYSKRFEVLKAETSWDSNRLVMLNEAREVLSDAARRAAYDASLDAPPPPRGARRQQSRIDDQPRSNSKWIFAGVILLVLVIWSATRDEEESNGTGPGVSSDQAGAESAGADQGGLEADADSADESVVVLGGSDAADVVDDETISEVEAATASAPIEAGAASAPVESTGTTAPPQVTASTGASTNTGIIGNWDCFAPVTGRNTNYRFADDGTVSIAPASGAAQTFSYEYGGGRISLVDTDPPQVVNVEELSARKMILSTSGDGQRVVCSR